MISPSEERLKVQVRVEGKRIAFSEIIVGPNRNIEDSRDQMKKWLADQGYEVGDIEFQKSPPLRSRNWVVRYR